MKERESRKYLKFLWLFGLTTILLSSTVSGATLDWSFSTSNGATTIAGTFATDGTLSDTQGTGTRLFTISEWKSLSLNGGDTGIPAERFPATPIAGVFTWDRDAQTILNPSTIVLNGAYHNESNAQESFFQLGFSPAQSRLQDFVDFSPNLSFVPVPGLSSFAPIPEPNDYGLAACALLMFWMVWRRWSQLGAEAPVVD